MGQCMCAAYQKNLFHFYFQLFSVFKDTIKTVIWTRAFQECKKTAQVLNVNLFFRSYYIIEADCFTSSGCNTGNHISVSIAVYTVTAEKVKVKKSSDFSHTYVSAKLNCR